MNAKFHEFKEERVIDQKKKRSYFDKKYERRELLIT